MRLSGTKANSTNQYRGLGDQLYDLGGARPTLDLNFANNKSLVDSVTGKNLVTHTRASSATYVDGDGLIKTATTNLLLRSEEFETSWGGGGVLAFGSGSVTDAAIAPNGTLTADLITEDTSVSSVHRLSQGGLTVAAGSNTVSIYAKRANGIRNVEINANALTNARAVFDLGNGTVGEIFSGTASIQSVGDGWYRCSVTGVSAGGTSALFIQIATGTTAASSTYTGDGTSGIYIWGAQLEQSSTVGEYVKTTSTINSAPRFDHDPVTGESLGLLVEEERTNLLERSKFNAAGNLAGVTRTATTEINPAGEAETQRLQCVADGTFHRIYYSSSSSNTITVSAFVKKDTHRYVNIGFGGGASSFSALFDIEPELTSDRLLGQGIKGSSTDSTNISAGYQDFPNGWVRIWATGTTAGTNGLFVQIAENATAFSLNSWNADGTEAIYVWGGQLEDDASFPTSLIHTDGSAVTRAADVASITGTNFSSWYRQDEGTVFAEFLLRADAGAGVVYLNDGSVNEATRIFYNSSISSYTLSVRAAGLEQSSINNLGAYVLQSEQISGAYKVNDLAASRNGGASISDTSATLPTGINRLELGTTQAANYLNGTISRLTYWPTRLSNDTLQTITK